MTAKKTAATPVKPAATLAKAGAKPALAEQRSKKVATRPVSAPVPAKAQAKAAPAKAPGKAAAKAAEDLKAKQGAKGKTGPVSKKENVRDENFVDVEADIEAEVEGV